MGEIIFLVMLLVGSLYLFSLTGDFPISILDKSGGAALFPRIVMIFLMIVLAVRILSLFRARNREAFVFTEIFKGTRGIYFGALVLYVLLMPFLGYIIATFTFVAGLMNTFYYSVHKELGEPKAIAIRNGLVVVLVICVNFFFKEVLGVFLPVGFLGI